MSYNYRSGKFSSRSLGGYLGYPASTYDSLYPSNVDCYPSTCQLGSSLYSDCQETCCEPTSCQTSYVASSPCQTSCYRPENTIFCSPCQRNYPGSLGYGNAGLGSFGYGCSGFQSLGCGSRFYRPTFFPSGSCQSTCYQPAFGSRFLGSIC
ncbi:keratin-associated protein 15-1-like [Microcebus murinus]|uniref:keratin-associated protein 15-1-like n=1 Tax=Microcebus murinus TaxID=30608 RepID=UPI003F6B8F93